MHARLQGARRQPQQRELLAPEYLRRRKGRQDLAASSAETGKSRGGGAPSGLHAFCKRIEEQGGLSLVAAHGWEADDYIAAACRVLEASCDGDATIIVASGDNDMQSLLSPRISWLQLLPFPTASAPSGARLHSAAAFEQRHGFPPRLYPDYLALAGKAGASIGEMPD